VDFVLSVLLIVFSYLPTWYVVQRPRSTLCLVCEVAPPQNMEVDKFGGISAGAIICFT